MGRARLIRSHRNAIALRSASVSVILMSTVEDILRAIEQLSPEDRWQVLQEILRMEGREPCAAMPDDFWNKLEELEQGR